MADQRDEITKALMGQGTTGGLVPQDFDTFSKKLNDPAALQAWLDAGGIYGQEGMTPPDEAEQYFANKGTPSGSVTDVGWMNALQPWQGGVTSGGQPGSGYNSSGFIGGGGMTRADPAYWGYQGSYQGFVPGSMGDLSGFNGGRGGAGGTGGLSPADFAVFSRLVSPQALQEWLSAGGVQGMADGGMGGAVGGGGGGVGGAVGGGSGSVGSSVGNANVGATVGRGGMSMGDALAATVNATPENFGTFGAMSGPGIGSALGAPSFGGLSGGYSPLGTMGTPPGYGNENGFSPDGGGLSAGGFY